MHAPELVSWPATANDLLARREWAHSTSRHVALGWDFGIRTNIAALGEHLGRVFAEMATDGEPEHWYSFVVTHRDGWNRHRLYRDGSRILDTPDASRAFLYLLWDVNQRMFRTTDDKVLVHASVVEHQGRGVLMSAPSGSGKTTLSLGLVARGLGYLTDEAAAFDPETRLIHPFPKSFSVDTGAQPFMEQYRPRHDPAIGDFLLGQWQVTPESVRPGATSGPVPTGWIVMPRYVDGGETMLTALSRAEALTMLMEQSLNLHRHGRAAFEVLADVVRGARCFHLIMGDLDSACDTMLAMLAEGPLDA